VLPESVAYKLNVPSLLSIFRVVFSVSSFSFLLDAFFFLAASPWDRFYETVSAEIYG
jgi:hypothetical protein